MFVAGAAGTALADFDRVFDRFAGKIPETLLGWWMLCHGQHDATGREVKVLKIRFDLFMMFDTLQRSVRSI